MDISEIAVQFQKLMDFSKRKKVMSSDMEDIVYRLNKLSWSLDWDIKSSSNINAKLSDISRDINTYAVALSGMSEYLFKALQEYTKCEDKLTDIERFTFYSDETYFANVPPNKITLKNVLEFTTKGSLFAEKACYDIVLGRAKAGRSLLMKTLSIANETFIPYPILGENGKLLNMIDEAIADGCKNVKFLSGAETVSKGRGVLNELQFAGKLGKFAGAVGIAVTPFVEFGASFDMYRDDLEVIRKYDPQDYNKELTKAYIGSAVDACTFGFIRSALKTPSSLIRLIPGEDPDWAVSYENLVDDTVNMKGVKNIYSQMVETN